MNDLEELLDVGTLESMELFTHKPSGKVYGMRLKGNRTVKEMSFIYFQKMLGDKRVLSNDFTLQQKGKEIHLLGYGKGRGTGLCAEEGRVMALKGAQADEILSVFFPKAYITRYPVLTNNLANNSLEKGGVDR